MKNNVRFYREKKMLSQGELATRVGVQAQTIWNLEHSRNKPRPSTLRRLSEVLEVSPDALFDESEAEHPANVA